MAREAIFTIAVTGGNHSKVVKVKQAGLTNGSLPVIIRPSGTGGVKNDAGKED